MSKATKVIVLAKDFIKLLMPSHAKNVQPYTDDIPLFLRYQVESQIEGCLEPIAQLKSGGYLVIHPTEALVSVDVNSGRSTKERNVERTAFKTNLEAADEVARQMRLRDLAGLVVIDFIDMDQNRNNRAVEKRMRDALAQDRARVQMGRISQFGLMELSRQRRRRSLLEGSSASCEHCHGVGRKRSVESSALKAVRAVEEEGVRGNAERIRLKVTPDVAAYLFNEKRDLINAIETENNMFTEVVADETLIRPAYTIEVLVKKSGANQDPLEDIAKEHRKEANARRSRPNNKSGNNKSGNRQNQNRSQEQSAEDANGKPETDETNKPSRSKRRRGRRGGRNRRPNNRDANKPENAQNGETVEAKADTTSNDVTKDKPETKKPARKSRATSKKPAAKQVDKSGEDKPEAAKLKDVKPAAKRARRRRKPAPQKSEEVSTDKAPAKKVAAKRPAARKAAPKKAPQKADAEKPAAKKETVKKTADEKKPTATPAPKIADKATPKPAEKPAPKATKDAKEDKKAKKAGWWQKRNPFT